MIDHTLSESDSSLFLTRSEVAVSTAPPAISGAQALIRKDLWYQTSQNPSSRLEYRYQDSKGTIFHNIATGSSETGGFEYVVGDQAWSFVKNFDTPTALLHLLFCAHAARQNRPWAEEMHISGTDLIRHLGLGHRKDLKKVEKIQEIVHHAHLLNSLTVSFEWSRSTSRRFIVSISRMWEISYTFSFKKSSEPHGVYQNEWRPDEVILTVRPGKWAEFFLNRDGLKDGSSLFFTGYLAETILRLNPYTEPIACRLAILLTLTWNPQTARRKVRNLIEYALPANLRADAVAGDRRKQYEAKQHFDQALFSLDQAGWRISFPRESYPSDLVPRWARQNHNSSRSPRRYWQSFTEAVLEIQAPGEIPTMMAANRRFSMRSGRQKSTRSRSQKTLGTDVRRSREAVGMSQRDLAVAIGRSRSYVAMIESGNRIPLSDDADRIRGVLKTESGERS
jgi:DNA-binding transcriptional regulator YiaG